MHIRVRSNFWSSDRVIINAKGRRIEAVGRSIENSNPTCSPTLRCHLTALGLFCVMRCSSWNLMSQQTEIQQYHIRCWEFLFCFIFPLFVSFMKYCIMDLESETYIQIIVWPLPHWCHLILSEPQFSYQKKKKL